MRLLLLGLTGAGKTTIAKILAEKHDLKLIEADDEVIRLNGGDWPNDENIIDKYFEVTNAKVLDLDNILYVISWLTSKRIKEFYDKGFIIFEMHASFDELMKRKIARDGMSDEEKNRFKDNYKGYVEDVLSKKTLKMFSLSLDTTKISSNQILQKICNKIRQK
jgi:adenylate kinase family enzyme